MPHWMKGLTMGQIRNELALKREPRKPGEWGFIGPLEKPRQDFPRPPVVWPNADVIAWRRMQEAGRERLEAYRRRMT